MKQMREGGEERKRTDAPVGLVEAALLARVAPTNDEVEGRHIDLARR